MSNESLINAKIAKFYKNKTKIYNEDVHKFLNNDFTYNFIEIADYLLPQRGRNYPASDLENYNYADYLQCYEKLLPIFIHTQNVLPDTTAALKHLNLKWVGENESFLTELFSATVDTQTETVERVLLLTAMLEYALGNVFYTQSVGRRPPHLLKDLLCTDELLAVFGTEPLLLLKLLVGTPNSINLRNIVWHGFPQPREVPPYYVSVLLVCLHSLGEILKTRYSQLQQREQIQDFREQLAELIPQLQKLEMPKDMTIHLENSKWLSVEHKQFWSQLWLHYSSAHYSNFVLLVLPQIELLLRLLYGNANNYDISAKLDEYYITMDTIFELHVPAAAQTPVRPNELLLGAAKLSAGVWHCLYDVFAAPSGLRLRDKVSHGEVHFGAINNELVCRLLWQLASYLLTANEMEFIFDNYESQFHTSSLTKRALQYAQKDMKKFAEHHLIRKIHKNEICSTQRIEIFQRPKNEVVIMNLIQKSAKLVTEICQNYADALEVRNSLLAQRELHSKRRRTLEKLTLALPDIFESLCELLDCLTIAFNRAQSEGNIFCVKFASEFGKLLRFLKQTLKICENLRKYSHKDSNEWIKAIDLCEKFKNHKANLFPWNS